MWPGASLQRLIQQTLITTPNSPNRMLGSIKKEGKSLFSQMSFNEVIN